MRNSLLVTSDLNSVVLVDTLQGDQRLGINKRGVLLSVLGTEICASEVSATLEKYINDTIGGGKPFYEFNAVDFSKNQLCLTYNDDNSSLFIIGITDIISNLTGPSEVPQNKVRTTMVKMKSAPGTGLYSPSVVLVRLEIIGTKRLVRFYYLPMAQ